MRAHAIALFVLAAACGSKPLTVEEYIAAAFHVQYTALVCVDGSPPSRVAPMEHQGLASLATSPWVEEPLKSIKAGRARFDGASARQCIEALALDWSTCWGPGVSPNAPVFQMADRAFQQLFLEMDLRGFARQDGNEGWLQGAPEVCTQVITGVLKDGDACYQSYECKSGNCYDPGYKCCPGCDCHYARVACPGVCVAAPGEGQPCIFSPSGAKCALGLLCQSGVCRKPPPPVLTSGPGGPGAPCTSSSSCSGRQLCLRKPVTCAGGVCAGPLVCSVPQDLGGPCAPVGKRYGLASGCYDHLFCNATTGKCEGAPKAGEPCACILRSANPTTGFCRDGVSCDSATAYCDGQTCQPLVDDGGSCTDIIQCRQGSICAGTAASPAKCVPLAGAPFPACVAPGS